MATTPRPGVPYLWVSWLTKLLAGESQCLYAPHFKSHFKYDKRPDSNFNLAAWTADHTALVTARASELRDDGWAVTIEGQNNFKLYGKSAVLAGQPDIVAVRDGVTLVVDGKTGQQCHADWWQVLIYMLVVPRVKEHLTNLHGEVCYKDHRIAVEPEELTTALTEQIYALIRTMGESIRPPTSPSQHDCGWCDIADCKDRYVDAGTLAAVAEEF